MSFKINEVTDALTNESIQNNIDKVQDVVKICMDMFSKEQEKIGHFNILITGKTGVGKSTLINAMFGEKITGVGIGKPITQHIKKLERDDFPLGIYDTPGIELGGENAIDELLCEIAETININEENPDTKISCIWYCINTTSHRFEQAEADFITRLRKETDSDVPIIIVLTQSYIEDDWRKLKSVIESENLDIANITAILAQSITIGKTTEKPFGLRRLARATVNAISEDSRAAFVALQEADIDLKTKSANKILQETLVLAAVTCAVPIPVTDSVALAGEQLIMCVRISAVYGIHFKDSDLAAIFSSIMGPTLATILGKTVSTSLLKIIPGVGQTIGATVAIATSTGITFALGKTFITICTKVYQKELFVSELSTPKVQHEIQQIFSKNYKKQQREKRSTPPDPPQR